MKTIMSLQQVENIFAGGGFVILWELPKCDRDMDWENISGNTVWVDFLEAGLPQTINV